jgi:hypothetical protein
MTAATKTDRETLLHAFFNDRRRAHEEIFKARHKRITPDFHFNIIDRLHERTTKPALIVGYRGCAKTTRAEEAVALMAGFREFHNGLILGSSERLAMKRLRVIRRIIEKNPRFKAVFGDLVGQPWHDTQLWLNTGISITAMGKGQSIRGTKDDDFRPDLVLADDIEDDESVRTDAGRNKIQGWFLGEVMQAMDREGRCIMLANILHEECLAEKLKNPNSGFTVDVYPAEYRDLKTGERKAMWPDDFPLEAIDEKRKSLYSVGRGKEFVMDYECRAIADRERPFRQDMKRVEPRVRLWEAIYAMYDPARTTGQHSATTGFAAWSWVGPRLVVWDMWAQKLMPDQIVRSIFETNQTFSPVKVGFEQDGLNEWALQPIRAEQVRRGQMLPLVPVKAPLGKVDFIKALTIFFTAHEVWFTQEFPDAWSQFLGFPTGNIDAPNALAYALHPKMKPGLAIYEDFNGTHVMDDLGVDHGKTSWLALNATGSVITAVLCQTDGERLNVLADWVREGEPADVLNGVLREANLEAGKYCRLVAGPIHYDRYNNVGLVQAVRRASAECRQGSLPDAGRNELRGLLRKMSRNLPLVNISSNARWTLNAMAGGYCRAVLKGGALAEVAEDGIYRTLAEGLESFAGLMRVEAEGDDDTARNYATTSGGQRYVSAVPRR